MTDVAGNVTTTTVLESTTNGVAGTYSGHLEAPRRSRLDKVTLTANTAY